MLRRLFCRRPRRGIYPYFRSLRSSLFCRTYTPIPLCTKRPKWARQSLCLVPPPIRRVPNFSGSSLKKNGPFGTRARKNFGFFLGFDRPRRKHKNSVAARTHFSLPETRLGFINANYEYITIYCVCGRPLSPAQRFRKLQPSSQARGLSRTRRS